MLQKAVCYITQEGLKFVVEDFSCVRGTAYFQQSVFRSYHFGADDPLEFAINLTTLIECLSIFGVAPTSLGHAADNSKPTTALSASKSITSLKMSCRGYGEKLNLMLVKMK
jgi:hypothetical protein